MKKRIIVKILSWIIALPVGGVLVVFSVVNRHSIRLDFWPLSLTAEVRLFVLILGILAVGVLWGGICVWLTGRSGRRKNRQAVRRMETENRRLENRISGLENELREARLPPPVSTLPADMKALPPTGNAH